MIIFQKQKVAVNIFTEIWLCCHFLDLIRSIFKAGNGITPIFLFLHSHYMKKIASQRVISKESALSMQTRISILVSDLVRVMRNVSERCDEKERSKHVQHYIHRMQFLGYPQEDRVLVYKKAKKVFENIVERDRIGECPMYRGKFWQRKERDKAKLHNKYKWYEKGGHETVMFIEATPNEQLAKTCRRALKEAGLKIRVVERAGKSIKRILAKSDPFRKTVCDQDKCKVCKLDSKANCKGRGVVYQMKCQGCIGKRTNDGLYVGETVRSVGERIGEHLTKYEVNDKSSVFHKYVEEKHGGERQNVRLKVVSSCGNDAMLRQVTEAVLIKELNPELNAKEEWGNSNALRERKITIDVTNLSNLSEANILRTQKLKSVLTEEAAEGQRKF